MTSNRADNLYRDKTIETLRADYEYKKTLYTTHVDKIRPAYVSLQGCLENARKSFMTFEEYQAEAAGGSEEESATELKK